MEEAAATAVTKPLIVVWTRLILALKSKANKFLILSRGYFYLLVIFLLKNVEINFVFIFV